ncbi:SRPBCC domain-containing protein [uncultured Psychroserpens sp.]|uniref:SRPBCC family protein n=1 Tax=uncultured Psychroserpens sp. TaxID=255436 RepID=UPI00262C7C92|nr:SRPBCC domain-containing protein [uncultured Psychroserpens sp.]
MKNKLFFDFTVNEKTNTIGVKREFAAELSLVWKAWTTSELLDQWWVSKDWVSQTKSMKFIEGGHRHYVVRGPEGEEFWGITTYDKIKLYVRFSGKDCFADENATINQDYPQSTYSIVFIDKGEKTLIEHHTTYPDLDQLKASIEYGFEDGMLSAFEKLDEIFSA